MKSVGIVDYGAGNIRSIENAFDHVGARVFKVSDSADAARATHLVLPGVGSFGYCRDRLEESGLIPTLKQWAIDEQKPLLGICVGFQLLAEYSMEHGQHEGLGWIKGRVLPLPSGNRRARVPHVGWNNIVFKKAFGRFGAGADIDFYFDHSFALFDTDEEQVIASCTHGTEFTTLVQRGNIVASQFHPEKSQDAGLDLLSGFLEIEPC